MKFVEIANAVDHVRGRAGRPASIIVWENVPGVLSTKDNAFGCFLGALVGESDALQPAGGRWTDAGCVYGTKRAAAWRVLDAQYFGLAQRRRRVFVVASARSGFDPAEVLFERSGVRRDSPPRREAREEAARGAGSGAAGCSYSVRTANTTANGHGVAVEVTHTLDTVNGQAVAFGGNRTSGPIDVAPALNACGTASGRQDFETEDFITTHTLRGEGFDASEDGTGRGTPLVPVAWTTKLHNTQSNQAGKMYREYATSLDANSPPPAVFQPVAFPANLSGTQHASTEDLAPAMGAKNPTAVAFQSATEFLPQSSRVYSEHETAPALQAAGARMGNRAPQVHTAMQARRLTPRECERLQGFPDDYTMIPWRNKPAAECPDGPRYKALGNSWAVPVVRWIGARVVEAMRAAA